MAASLFAHREFYDRTPPGNTVQHPSTAMDPRSQSEPKLNIYFQTAVADPARKKTSHEQRMYRSANLSAESRPPMTGTIQVTVGSDPASCRIWILPKALIARHSASFDELLGYANIVDITLSNNEPREFQNFVDYMHSSIYSLNTNVPGFRAIRANTEACLLGLRFGAKAYHDAAIRQLYMIFEPLAQLRTSNARKSSIRASDIEFICTHTSPTGTLASPDGPSNDTDTKTWFNSGVRQLFFDAVASHWTQRDTLRIGAHDTPGDTVSWTEVYNKHPDFRCTLANSLLMADVWRAALLRPVGDYLSPKFEETHIKKEGVDDGMGWQPDGAARDMGHTYRAIASPRPRLPALSRTNSSGRRRWKRSESPEVDLGDIRRRNAIQTSEEAVEEEEWTMVGAEAAPEA